MPSFTDEEKINLMRAHEGDGRLFEDIITCFYEDLCYPGDHVIDAGANRGHHTFKLASTVGSAGRVLAIEPVPILAEMIEATSRRFKVTQLKLVVAALSDHNTVAEFFFRRDMDGWSSLFETHVPPNTLAENITRFYASIITLDDLAHLVEDCKFIKLDLEMNEFQALRGAQTLLKRDRPVMIFENARENAAKLGGYKKEDFFELFKTLDYSLFDIFMDPMTPDRWQGDPTMPVYNIAVPSAHVDELKALPIQEYYTRSKIG